MQDKFLDKAYGVTDPEDLRRLYDDWSQSYDAEISENGYATPGRAAKALRKFVSDPGLPVLDYGCGTGLSGAALKHEGFEVLDGADISTEMLDQARGKGLYRELLAVDPADPVPFDKGAYAAIAAVGVIGPGAGPIDLLDRLMEQLDSGGFLVFSLNDHALKDRRHKGRMNEHIDTGSAMLLHAKHGPHLPGIGLKSSVYVLEKR
ncbi:methyltransferase domain-containing protein [Thalassococcus profundi]|uniref:Methyltransferase domain-containing protein n=1 Tax=Thalassococcus profundi TaxID=2282382 RepID=A0A369TSG2_9RHOB|nr:methyltransferase domain-containing protein [Thalassococcus profundi]RDD67385.1 methyltransferase domain-containing protein [Thalassococcus profundi]